MLLQHLGSPNRCAFSTHFWFHPPPRRSPKPLRGSHTYSCCQPPLPPPTKFCEHAQEMGAPQDRNRLALTVIPHGATAVTCCHLLLFHHLGRHTRCVSSAHLYFLPPPPRSLQPLCNFNTFVLRPPRSPQQLRSLNTFAYSSLPLGRHSRCKIQHIELSCVASAETKRSLKNRHAYKGVV